MHNLLRGNAGTDYHPKRCNNRFLCSAEYYYAERAKLGHDPLREDADADVLWERIKDSKKPIGGILMDQTLIAGVGNIYRAEVSTCISCLSHLLSCDRASRTARNPLATS